MSETILQSQNNVRPLPLDPLTVEASFIDEIQADPSGRLFVTAFSMLPLSTAFSCLIAPQAGDQVSCLRVRDRVYVTSILKRRPTNDPVILSSGKRALSIHAPSVEIQTDHLSILTRTTHWLSELFQQTAQRLFIKARHCHRQIENTDHLQARHIRQDAEQSLAIHSRIGSLSASAVLRVDGSQIHMG